MIRSPATRWNHAKTTRLRDCTIATKISIFIAEAWISGSQKSNGISQDEVFADHGENLQEGLWKYGKVAPLFGETYPSGGRNPRGLRISSDASFIYRTPSIEHRSHTLENPRVWGSAPRLCHIFRGGVLS
jgi:hypothetical protein